MNVLSLTSGGLTGGSSGAMFPPAAPSTAASLPSLQPASAVSPRDTVLSSFLDASSPVNGLQQAASTLFAQAASTPATSSTDASAAASQLDLPPLPAMPAPQPPPNVPTDDHGQSNIVFSDADGDGSLIH